MEDLNEADLNLGGNLEAPVLAKPGAKKKPATVALPGTTRIIVEENDNIPPTGLYVGLNGRGYLIRPGEVVDVPNGVKEILDNAIETVSQIDPLTRRVVGYRQRTRFPYRLA